MGKSEIQSAIGDPIVATLSWFGLAMTPWRLYVKIPRSPSSYSYTGDNEEDIGDGNLATGNHILTQVIMRKI
jgi:hypothetical protein